MMEGVKGHRFRKLSSLGRGLNLQTTLHGSCHEVQFGLGRDTRAFPSETVSLVECILHFVTHCAIPKCPYPRQRVTSGKNTNKTISIFPLNKESWD